MTVCDTFIQVNLLTQERKPKMYEKYIRVDQIFGVIAPSEEMIVTGAGAGVETFQGMYVVKETVDEVMSLLSKVPVGRL